MESYGIAVGSEAEITKMVSIIDQDGNNTVQFTELMRLMVAKSNFFDSRPEAAEATASSGIMTFIRRCTSAPLNRMSLCPTTQSPQWTS